MLFGGGQLANSTAVSTPQLVGLQPSAAECAVSAVLKWCKEVGEKEGKKEGKK